MALSHPSKSPVKRITIGTHSVPVYWKESEQGWQAKWVEHGEVRRKFSRSLPKLRKAIKAIFASLADELDWGALTPDQKTVCKEAIRLGITTHYEYTSDSWLRKLKSDNANTGQQVTEWVYGVSPTKGSDLYSNRLVYQKIYPDGESSSSSGATVDRVTNTFNRQQQLTTMTDQLGTVHDYSYDKLGRLLSDSVVGNFGTNVDQSIGKLETGYDERGRVIHNTSYDTAGTSKVNQVVREYNNFNQLVTEYQEHSATFDPDTSRKVTYTYADGANNTPIRPTSIKYPHTETATSSTTIAFAYVSQQSDALSRFDEIKDGSDILSSFKYVGLGMMVAQKYNAAANTELTYGDSSNDYNGYDLFGRIAKTLWKEGSNTLVESEYGQNRVGGVTWRRDVEAHAQSEATQDNYYWYDGLYQVTQHERGDLTGAPYSGIDPTTRQQQEIFTFDETGNWLGYDREDPSLDQDRTHNKANEITSISPTSGAGAAVQPVYDKAGNMTTMPQPADWESGYDCTWDAWNRLVKIEDGATTVAEYRYDALTRRISQATSAGSRRYFYNNQWRVIEEWDTTGTTDREYVYNPADRWNLIRRKYTDSSPLDTTHYVLRDFLDPVAIINTSGVVQERYGYDAFGPVRFMDAGFATLTNSAHGWNWLFHGEFLDTNTGLYNYGYRYYHPQLGRWPSRDPIEEAGGVNLYGMVGNNAVNGWDYLGLEFRYADAQTRKYVENLAKKAAKHSKCFKECWKTLKKSRKVIFVILKPGRGSRVRGGNFHWRYLWVDPDQGKKTGYSMESILVHEITHLCQHHSGRRGDMTDAESEKEAIDCANEYREHEDVGEKLRPYSDHERITEEDIKRWEDEEGEKKKDSCE
ncbi:RHS repeat-associated core domain-containing protein, partial [Akkermansiaceae bacterium]|nr:RHS repeat-associated core domain-containing protein [Akkermansiaceae bacterium]